MNNTSGFFKTIGLSFKNAALDIREQLAMDEEHIKKLLKFIGEYTDASDALVLSTCNRTEIYYSHQDDLKEKILKGLAIIKGLSFNDVDACFDTILDNDEAVEHLFKVSMGLEAQVVGDLQISNQVKMAYQWYALSDVETDLPCFHQHSIDKPSKEWYKKHLSETVRHPYLMLLRN